MKTNELRIGNKVIGYKCEATIQLIDTVNVEVYYGKYPDENTQVLSLKDIKPIKLTENLMYKFGFTREGTEAGDDGALQLGCAQTEQKLCFLWIPKEGRYTEKHAVGIWLGQDYNNQQLKIDIKRVKYVHQLQNLYYALTGKELKLIKEK